MLEYSNPSRRSESYETANSVAYGLRLYKRKPSYKLQLRREILDAGSAELRACTDTEKRKARARKFIAQSELDYLEAGGAPTALSGFIALKI